MRIFLEIANTKQRRRPEESSGGALRFSLKGGEVFILFQSIGFFNIQIKRRSLN